MLPAQLLLFCFHMPRFPLLVPQPSRQPIRYSLFWESGGLIWVIVPRLPAPSPTSLCLLLEGIHHLSICHWTSGHIYGSTRPGRGKQVTRSMAATAERRFQKVCGFSFRSDERKKKEKSKPKPSRLPARSLRNTVQAKASVGQEGNYRP